MYKSQKITRNIAEYTETVTALWCIKDFTKNTALNRLFRQIFGRPRPSLKCFVCGHGFKDNESMGLAHFEDIHGNKMFCSSCAEKFN